MKKGFIEILCLFWIPFAFPVNLYSQVYIKAKVNQPPTLSINSLDTLTIEEGTAIQVGGENIVSGGYGDHIYTWDNSGTMNSNYISNPTVSPGESTTFTLIVTDSNGCIAIAHQHVNVDQASSIDHHVSGIIIKVFPNPSKGIFNFEIKDINEVTSIRICIFNITGNQVYEKEIILHDNQYSQQINLSNNPAGNYLLRIYLEDTYFEKKIVIQ